MSKTNIKIIRGDDENKHIINGDIREGLVSPISMYELTISSKAEVVNPTQLKFSKNIGKYSLEISPEMPQFSKQGEDITIDVYLLDSAGNYTLKKMNDIVWYINDTEVATGSTEISLNESDYNSVVEYQGRVEMYVQGEYLSQTFTITNKVVELLNSIDVNIIAQNGNTFTNDIDQLLFIAESSKDGEEFIPDRYEWYLNGEPRTSGFSATIDSDMLDRGQHILELWTFVGDNIIKNKEVINKLYLDNDSDTGRVRDFGFPDRTDGRNEDTGNSGGSPSRDGSENINDRSPEDFENRENIPNRT